MFNTDIHHSKSYVNDVIISFNATKLTHCGLVMQYGITELGNFGSGNSLLPDGTKPWPEPNNNN